ncbi:MAG TPA: sialidase family protein, partial [Fimbriimonadaceae bacterium]|nr:sialidase family protein [Fimbriimonadaceae bacterium]
MDSKRRWLRMCVVTIGLLVMIGPGLADAQAPGDDRPTAWTEMMLEFLATGQMPLAPVAATSLAAPTFPGVSPTPNLNVTPGGGTQDQTETTVAVGLGAFSSNIVVGYNDRAQLNGGFSGYSFSTDGGQTFTQSTAMPQPAGGNLAGDPVLDTHPAFPGRVYYASLCSANTIPMGTLGICVSISNDGGQNFGNPVVVSTPTCNTTTSVMNDCDTFDKEWLAVDSFTGNVYIAYTNFVGGGPPQPPATPGSGSLRGQIEAVVCNAALTTCSAPFAVAGNNSVYRQGVSVTFGRTAGQEMVLAWYNRSSGFIESTNCAVGAGPAITVCAALTNVVNVGT